MSPRIAAEMIFHWLTVSRFCRSRSSNIASSRSLIDRVALRRNRFSCYRTMKLLDPPNGSEYRVDRPKGRPVESIDGGPALAMAQAGGHCQPSCNSVAGGLHHWLGRTGDRQCEGIVNLLERAAPGLIAEDPETDQAEDIPRGEIDEDRAEHDEVGRRRLYATTGAQQQRRRQAAR